MIVTVFRARGRPGADEAEAARLGARMVELATKMPGFVAYKDFAAADGESVSIVEFETLAHVEAWRNHPEHRAAQERGRAALFAEYHIQTCEVVRDMRFPK